MTESCGHIVSPTLAVPSQLQDDGALLNQTNLQATFCVRPSLKSWSTTKDTKGITYRQRRFQYKNIENCEKFTISGDDAIGE